jgi:hypothetical protein
LEYLNIELPLYHNFASPLHGWKSIFDLVGKMDVEMKDAPLQGRKLRRVVLPRKSSTSLRLPSPTSPTSAGLDDLLSRKCLPNKYPRRTVTPPPLRFNLTASCKELFNPNSRASSLPSPTRIHKPAYPAQIPYDLSIPGIPNAERSGVTTDLNDIEKPKLTPFDIPVILEHIIFYLDELNTIPSEPAPVRRKPLSYQHAILIYHPDVERAKEIWADACRPNNEDNNCEQHHSGVFTCLLVNKRWNDAAKRVLRQKAFFTNYDSWKIFARRRAGHTPHLKMLILHKVRQARDEELELLGEQPKLEWLGLHVCPELLPMEQLLCSTYLKRLALPGCSRVNDSVLEIIARNCPNLEILDLRACELVTDKGLIAIAQGCPKLQYLNVGRVKGGERITCEGVDAIARYSPPKSGSHYQID